LKNIVTFDPYLQIGGHHISQHLLFSEMLEKRFNVFIGDINNILINNINKNKKNIINLTNESINNFNKNYFKYRFIPKIKNIKNVKEYFENVTDQMTQYSNKIVFTTTYHNMWPLIMTDEISKIDYAICLISSRGIKPKNKYKKLSFNYFLINNFLKKSKLILVTDIELKKYLQSIGCKNVYLHPVKVFRNKNSLKNIRTNKFILGSIGGIRAQKDILFILNSLKDRKYHYLLAGALQDEYAEKVKETVNDINSKYIKKIFKHLDIDTYNKKISELTFGVIPPQTDKYILHSSGIFWDYLMNSVPVIAPEQFKFKYFIDKYNVGVTYEEYNEKSFIKAIEKAKEIDYDYFIKNIKKFQNKFTFSEVSENFCNVLDNAFF